MAEKTVIVIGAGLAGCEAAWQAARLGARVELYEMKPKRFSPAHSRETFAELVCSNSLRSDRIENAVGLLKQEMRRLDSLILSGCPIPPEEAARIRKALGDKVAVVF